MIYQPEFSHPIGEEIEIDPSITDPEALKLIKEYQLLMHTMGLEEKLNSLIREENGLKKVTAWYEELRAQKKYQDSDYIREALKEVKLKLIINPCNKKVFIISI